MAVDVLDIRTAHAIAVGSLPFHHRDPFDRLLVAQALTEGVAIVSRDQIFDSYSVPRLW
jgi:PIN domain nuclease of toxin-antitoxin system